MKIACVVFALSLGSSAAWGGDFQRAYEAALQNDASLKGARAELSSVRQNVPMAQASLLPNLALTMSSTWVEGNRTLDNPNGTLATNPLSYRAPVQALSLRAPIFNFEATQKVKQARAQVDYAEAAFAVRTAALLDRLASAYFQRLLSAHAINSASAQWAAAQAQATLATRRYQRGEGTRTEMADGDAALATAKVLLDEAQHQSQLAHLELQQMTGLSAAALSQPVPRPDPAALFKSFAMSPYVLADLIAKAETANVSIAARKQAILVAQAALARNDANHFPRLDLVAGVSKASNESLSTLNQSVSQRSLGLQLNLPIYSGGYVSAAVTQSLADLNKAEAELVVEQELVARDITKLYLLTLNGNSKLQARYKSFEASQLTLEGLKKGTATGFNTPSEVVVGAHKLAAAEQDLAQAIYEHFLAHMRLITRTGVEPAQAAGLVDSWLSAF